MKFWYLSFLAAILGFSAVSAQVDSIFTSLPQNEFDVRWYGSWDRGDWTDKQTDAYQMFDADVLLNNTVVITEFCMNGKSNSYVELTNLGTEAVDLSEYEWGVRRYEGSPEGGVTGSKIDRMFGMRLEGILAPGESYILMTYRYRVNTDPNINADSIASHNVYLEQLGDLFVDANDKKAYDMVGTWYNTEGVRTPAWHFGRAVDFFVVKSSKLNYAAALYKVVGDTAQVVVDCVEQLKDGRATVAGVFNAINTHAWVRKQFTEDRKHGNPDFLVGSGQEAAKASEWILIPRFNSGTTNLFSTIGSHDPSSTYSVAPKEGSNVVIDEANSVITVPYPTFRGDSVISSLVLANDMAWSYKTNGVVEEEESVIVMEADSITFYHCGVDVTEKTYHLSVGAPLPDKALIFSSMYDITFGLEVDTISGGILDFDYPVDTLLAYLQYAEGTGLEVDYVDDVARPLLKTGDKIIVTSADKTNTHEYAIKLLPYEYNQLSHDASLKTITWPDCRDEDLDFDYVWTRGDTIPAFNTNGLSYFIKLPVGTTEVPALAAMLSNARASLTIKPATDLFGSAADQTTELVVTAEDDSIINTYKVRFIVEREESTAFEGEPFFSELAENGDGSMMIEIVNPTSDLMDMSDYVIAGGKSSWKTLPAILTWETVEIPDDFYKNSKIYRPGYVMDSIKSVTYEQVWFDPNGDADIDSYVEAGECFTLVSTRGRSFGYGHVSFSSDKGWKWRGGHENGITEGPNVVLHHGDESKNWDWNKHGGADIYRLGRVIGDVAKENTYFLLKILNDSIKDGSKDAFDVEDYEIIDVVGKSENGMTVGWLRAYDGTPCFPGTREVAGNLQRLPNISKGNPVSMGSFGYEGIETPTDYDAANPVLGDSAAFEWNYFDASPSNFDLGHHAMYVTVQRSTVNSTVYEVSKGYTGSQTIEGVAASTTVTDFYANVIKEDANQVLSLLNSAGTPKAESDIVATNDILMVTSADAKTVTMYMITLSDLNSDVSLTSSTYTVAGTEISGLTVATTLKEVKENVEANALSTVYFVDESGATLPLISASVLDSMYYDVTVAEDISVKVIAQNGDVQLYSLNLGTTSADAYVTSSLYLVDEDAKSVAGIADGTNVEQLLANLIGSHNATVTVINNMDQERDFGHLVSDDRIKVVSEDQSKTVIYELETMTEWYIINDVEVNELPQVGATLYPNPTTGEFFIKDASVDYVEVYDLSGKLVVSDNSPESGVNIAGLARGVYVVKLIDADGVVDVVKVVKE